jgi:branched-chain amino acid aminotransferase
MKVYFNGRIIEEDEAFIPANDRGVLFETVRAYEGKPFRMERHLTRLREACRELRLDHAPADGDIVDTVSDLYIMNVGSGDAYVRITLTGGPFDGNRTLERHSAPNTHITVKPFEGYPPEYYDEGMRVILSSMRRNEASFLSRFKTNNYLSSLAAKQEAKDRGADDAVMLNVAGNLAESTSSNLFMVIGGKVVTPDVDCGLLPGITREAVLELCERSGTPY